MVTPVKLGVAFFMTKAQLIADLKNITGPGIDVNVTGLLMWVNDAYMYMCDEITKVNSDYFAKSAFTSTVNGQQEYTLPSDFERIKRVEIKLDGVWRRVTPLPDINTVPVVQNISSYTLTDYHYYVINGEIGFTMPIGETTVNNIKIWYVYNPAELAEDADEPAIPKKYHHLIKLGATANYADRDSDHGGAEVMRKRFEKRVEDMIETIEPNQVDEPRSIQITHNYDMYYNDEQDI